ncbi:alkaline phosphatase D family protein [uncultured Croceitalea sp.]|uniref:alkaline phosphatase D family protein n=1 Tax=uncultured Croceitalea sp. TaxID=1798908 RepID=UPI003305FC3D
MRSIATLFTFIFILIGCKTKQPTNTTVTTGVTIGTDFRITFGSCNKSNVENLFWDDISDLEPDVFIWGGDIVYADTDNVSKIQEFYDKQDSVPAYLALKKKVMITGTWDDHDYGINDGGVEFSSKEGSQQAFLNFLDVQENDARRKRKGVYSSKTITKPQGSVKIINLDTRYFRTALTKDEQEGRRYKAGTYGKGTILGEAQWNWLKEELDGSEADFNLIVTSIQFLSKEHGFEKWANHPHEVDKMKKLIVSSGAKGVILLSGDRHISEFSKIDLKGLSYPLIDFTSSGLTHAYSGFNGEVNLYRVGEVVSVNSYGLIELDVTNNKANFKIMGDNGQVLQELKQTF